jgi:hypothetical protein
MIKEELYIIKDGEKYNLDLPTPSGITLKWVSNLFSDISKLTCSYSYTFKLPMTANNRRVLDIADDLRHSSAFARISVDAEFYINGVCLCPNANLHVSEIGASSFSCVMTWRVLKAFEKMKSDSIKLNELPSIGTFVWKTGDDSLIYGLPTHNQKNTENILYPNYDAGIPYTNGVPPKPVVPIYRLIQLINNHYGVKFALGRELTDSMGLLPKANFNNKRYYGKCVYDDYITYGVLPITGIGVSSGTQNKFTVSNLEGKPLWDDYVNVGSRVYVANYTKWKVTSTNQGAQDSYHDIIKTKDKDLSSWKKYSNLMAVLFNGNKYIQNVGYSTSRTTTEENELTSKHIGSRGHGEGGHYYTHWELYACTGELKESFAIKKDPKGSGLFRCGIDSVLRGEAEVRVSKEDIKAGKAELKDYWWIYILRFKQGDEDKEADIDIYSDESDDWMGLRSISREETDTEYIYKFDFGAKYEVRKLSIDAADDDEFGLCFWSGSLSEGWVTKDADNNVIATGIKYSNTATFSYLRILSITPTVQFDGLPAEMDIVENLPDISCFDFIKNLFYLNGALPRVEKDGTTISAMYYNQLRDRVVNGDCLDWSNKILSGSSENPTSTKTYNSNFGCENYFLMAETEKDKTEEEKLKELELYGAGYGQLSIDDKRLDDEKTVFTSCFYPGLRTDLAYPNVLTGRTIKVWNGEKQVQSEVNPIFGYVNYRALDSTFEDVSNASSRPMLNAYGVEFKHIRMNTFEPFADMDEFYGYLKSILADYAVIKEKFILNEFDLKNFDESIPVYLQKYNCCFAVSTIQRDKNGISTVELVKLPYVTPIYAIPEGIDADKTGYSYRITNSIIGFELQLERNYTSNRCPIRYEIFANNEHGEWRTTYNTLNEPINGSYISQYVCPYEADKLKGNSYQITFSVPQVVNLRLTKTRGIDVVYTKDMNVKLRVYYDDVRCEPEVNKTLTFTRDDFGKFHVFKFIFDIYSPEGDLVERVRKKMYYFVSDIDQMQMTDEFGDEHENDNSIKVNDVTISGADSIADKDPHPYTLSFLPAYADIKAKSVVVSIVERVLSLSVSNVSTSGFTLTASELPEREITATIMMEVTLEDGSTFTKEKVLSVLRPSLYISTKDIDVIDGSGSATFSVYVRPIDDGGVIKKVKTTHDNVKTTIASNKSFEVSAKNVTESMNEDITVTVEYKGMTITGTTTVKINGSVNRLDYYGALIVDRNGNYYTKDEWIDLGLENNDADGVAISDNTHRFILSKKNLPKFGVWGTSGTLIGGVVTSDDALVAQQDFAGKANTDVIAKALPNSFAAKLAGRNDFPSGKTGYCAALGEWNIIGGKRSYINQLLNTIGADELFYNSNSCDYFSTTQYNAYRLWIAHFGANVELEMGYKDSEYFMRPLAAISEEMPPTPIGNLEIVGGENFMATNGSGSAEYSIKYSPEGVSIAEVSITSNNPAVVATKISDVKFNLSVSGIIVDEVAIITVRARLNNIMRKVAKTITAVGEIVVNYDKLDNANALILCKDYTLYTEDEWIMSKRTKSDVEGIAVSNGKHRLIMAISDAGRYYYGGRNIAIDGLSTDTGAYNGKNNTEVIVKQLTGSDGYFTGEPYSAAAVAKHFLFPTGKAGFLPSYAEWVLINKYYEKVEALLTAVGGDALIKDFSFTYWASTTQDNLRGYCYHCYKSNLDGSINRDMSGNIYRSDASLVRSFRNF